MVHDQQAQAFLHGMKNGVPCPVRVPMTASHIAQYHMHQCQLQFSQCFAIYGPKVYTFSRLEIGNVQYKLLVFQFLSKFFFHMTSVVYKLAVGSSLFLICTSNADQNCVNISGFSIKHYMKEHMQLECMSKIGKIYYCTVLITAVWQPQKFQSFIMVEVLLYIANYVIRMCRASFASSYSCV